MTFFEILICIIAGVGAGLGTGFAGMSAAVVVSPMLITFLGMDAYLAIGIALASDILASGVSAYTYSKNKNIDLRNGILMMIPVIIFTLIGSYISSFVDSTVMGNFSLFSTTLLGIKFILLPVNTTKDQMNKVSKKVRMIQSIVGGTLIGFICGFIGAGGGMMMLLILTTVLGYELKTAIGTSVFIMTFTALTGATSHFIVAGMPDIGCLVVCVISTLIWARLAALFANKATPKVLNRAMGILLTVMGVGMICFEYIL